MSVKIKPLILLQPETETAQINNLIVNFESLKKKAEHGGTGPQSQHSGGRNKRISVSSKPVSCLPGESRTAVAVITQENSESLQNPKDLKK